jgi:hypothetical protein
VRPWEEVPRGSAAPARGRAPGAIPQEQVSTSPLPRSGRCAVDGRAGVGELAAPSRRVARWPTPSAGSWRRGPDRARRSPCSPGRRATVPAGWRRRGCCTRRRRRRGADRRTARFTVSRPTCCARPACPSTSSTRTSRRRPLAGRGGDRRDARHRGRPAAARPARAAATWLRRHDVPVVALDLPSGLSADIGLKGPCVTADVTVALGAPTHGLQQAIVHAYVGDLYLADLGIPPRPGRRRGSTRPRGVPARAAGPAHRRRSAPPTPAPPTRPRSGRAAPERARTAALVPPCEQPLTSASDRSVVAHLARLLRGPPGREATAWARAPRTGAGSIQRVRWWVDPREAPWVVLADRAVGELPRVPLAAAAAPGLL